MQNPLAHLPVKAKFVLAQIVALGFVLPMPSILSFHTFLPGATALAFLGCCLGIVGLVRCGQNGQSASRLLAATLICGPATALAWTCLLMALGFLVGLFVTDPLVANYFLYFHVIQLPFFTTGTLAYFGIFPFRSRMPAGQRARQLIVGNRDLRLGGPAAPALVERAEQLLGLRLPGSYREFLLDYGEIRAPWIRVLGLGPATDLDRPTPDDVVGATLAAWEQHGLPRGYFVCAVGTDGNWACVDTVAPASGEGQVVVWDVGKRTMAGLAANNFSDYLTSTLSVRRT
jgi:hypothetical protein